MGTTAESFDPKYIDFQQYLVNCFLKKIPGSGTEHCDQKLPADVWGKGILKHTTLAGTADRLSLIMSKRFDVLDSVKQAILTVLSVFPGELSPHHH